MHNLSDRQKLYRDELKKAFAAEGFDSLGSTTNASDFNRVEKIKFATAHKVGLFDLQKRDEDRPLLPPGVCAGMNAGQLIIGH